jgi:enoyl-CoA hydratase/carnithine racemase
VTAYENLTVSVEESIGTITINRPKVLNALNTATLRELKSAALEMQANDQVKVIILTGAERSFAAGADIA